MHSLKATEQNLSGEQVAKMSIGLRELERLSIRKLKELIELLKRTKNPIDKETIKIIRTLIDHKKGRINLMQ